MEGEQAIYVVVTDQKVVPVAGVEVTAVVEFPSGAQQAFTLPPTNDSGVSELHFTFKTGMRGLATVQVAVSYQNLQEETTTSFRIWW
jgi:hypothetical protein